MTDPRRRVARVAGLLALVTALAYLAVELPDLLGLRGAPRVFVFLLLTVGILAGIFLAVAAAVLDEP